MMRCDTPQAIAWLTMDVCRVIARQDRMPPKNHVGLILGTSAAESSMQERAQRNPRSEGALGLWQMEIPTARSIFKDNLRYRWFVARNRHRWRRFVEAWLGIKSVPFFMPTDRELRFLLMQDDRFACVMARWKYLMVPEPIPETLAELAVYWKVHYNTEEGLGTLEHFIAQWDALGCQNLLNMLGYAGGIERT